MSFYSLICIFDSIEDTFARKCNKKNTFSFAFYSLIRIIDYIEDTFARKCNKKNTFSFAFYSLIRIFAHRKEQKRWKKAKETP